MSVLREVMAEQGEDIFRSALYAGSVGVSYQPPKGDKFDWEASVGEQRGADVYDPITGDRMKVIKVHAVGPRSTLESKGVVTIEKNASVFINSEKWEIDVPECRFGPTLVRLGLLRKFTTSHESMTANGTI